MAASTNPMKALRQRLSSIGIKKKYLNEIVLPDWWNDEIALVPAGFSEGLIYISRRLGLTPEFLAGDARAQFRSSGNTKFKKANGVEARDVQVAQAIAVSAARVVNLGISTKYSLLEETPLEIRDTILKQAGMVNLSSILDFCWGRGIPVIHVSRFPMVGKKMDGLCAMVDGRPIIVVSKNSKFPAWLVFIIAHELGHVFAGHVSEDTVLVDQNLGTFDVDGEEQQANAFASTVLSGHQNFSIKGPQRIKGEDLAESAKAFGIANNIDPGVVLLNYAWTMKNFACANKALGFIEHGCESTGLIHRKMLEHIDLSEIPEETREWLLRVADAEQYA